MGWASGTYLVRNVAEAIRENVADDEARKRIYRVLVEEAEMCDWDCQNEVEGIDPILDKIVKRR